MLVNSDNAGGLLFGRVCAVDAVMCRIRVRLDDRDGLQTHWVHVPQRNTHENQHRSLPDFGGHVAVLLAANGVDGVYLGSIYSGAEPPPIVDEDTEYVRFSDGTVVSHNCQESRFHISCSGSVEIFAADTAHVKAGTSATLETPDVIVTGNMTVKKKLIIEGGMEIQGGSGNTATVSGNMQVDGNITATGSVMDAGGNSNHHSH